MPGRHVTQQQARLYMTYRKDGLNQKAAAAKVSISERSGRAIETGESPPKPQKRAWRTRKDPLAGVWDEELVPFLKEYPELSPLTLLEYLQKQYPERYPDNVLRTLQRRVKQWRALHGSERDVMFEQRYAPGVQCLSDFTQLKGVTITIKGSALPHLLYHFRLRYSGWSFMKVIQGGESYTALAEGLQEAFWRLGGVPKEHRTDSLSAAYKNHSSTDDFTQQYKAFCQHYNVQPTRNNRGKSHENGAIESPHGHLKRRIEQALVVRGSYDFESIQAYNTFIDTVVRQHNRRNAKSIDLERPYLQDLPERQTSDFTELSVKVTSTSIIRVNGNVYTVPSRLIGSCLRIHLYDNRLQCFYGSELVVTLDRVYCGTGGKRGRNIDYKHVYQALMKKPSAFRRWVYRDDLLPTPAYHQIWQAADTMLDPHMACKYIVGCLTIAAKHDCEQKLADCVLQSLQSKKLPSLSDLQKQFGQCPSSTPNVEVQQHDLSSYDTLGGNPCTA